MATFVPIRRTTIREAGLAFVASDVLPFPSPAGLSVRTSPVRGTSTLSQLTACAATVRHWFMQNGLQLNASKSQAMMLGTPAQLQSVGAAISRRAADSGRAVQQPHSI